MQDHRIRGFIIESLKPFKFLIVIEFFIGLSWAIDLSLRPYILKIILDKIPNLAKEAVFSELSIPIVFYVMMLFFYILTSRFSDFIWLKLNPPLKGHVGDVLMERMMKHSQTLFQDHFAGSLANKINDVMGSIPRILKLTINHFLTLFLALVIAIFTLWTINYKFSILLAVWLIVFLVSSLFFALRAKKLCDKSAEVRSTLIGRMVDILSNIMNIHLFSARKIEAKKLKIHLDEYVAIDQRRDWLFLITFACQGASFVIYQTISIIFLISGFKDGSVSAGDFVLLLTLNIKIIDQLHYLSIDMLNFAEYWGQIVQGLRIALAPIEIKDKPMAKTLQVIQGRIVFDNVTFHYKGTIPLFENMSVVIKPGQKVGLVGYSGSGKTTFVNLILRLYDITGGRIIIDACEVRDVTQDSLRANIGMIPQEPSLFHRTLMENIRYGKANATDADVIEAAKRAYAHDFIKKLPNGYDSLVGERGIKLSGGQRQRIAIARAMLKNAPILILDEATSQLDSMTEHDIQDSLWNLMQNKTTLVIAHRLSTLLHMDRILVFDGGKIIEDGTHDVLLTRRGLYKTLWDAQVGGFLPDKENVG